MKKISKSNSTSKRVVPKIKIKKKSKTNSEVKEKKKFTWQTVLNIILLCAIAVLGLFLAFILYIVFTSPKFTEDALYQSEPTVLYDRNGNELAVIGSVDTTLLTYDEIPEVLIDSLVATEDSRFFQHNGIDLLRFVKASFKQLLGSNDAGGASTLSMQLVKNKLTQKGKKENKIESFVRKFRDIYLAVFKLEPNYTKEEIIEFYLNTQWFATDKNNVYVSNGIYGIERASEFYFNKSAKDLNLAEASLMAGMFQNPYLYNPFKNPEGCRNRQRTVLKLMVKHGYITEEQKDAILDIPIETLIASQNSLNNNTNSNQAFIDYVVKDVENKLKLDVNTSSLKIYTTFDPDIQKTVNKVQNGEAYKFPNDVVQEGIAVTSSDDGSIVALSGGRNYQAKGLNLATDLNKQPGSTAKPLFDYAMYIEHITQSTYDMILDEKTTYSNGTTLGNYDGKFKGLITMRYALKDSRNIPALRTFKKVYAYDKSVISDFVHSVGIDYGKDLFESASIGAFNGVSPLELSAAYATFARGGYYIEPYSYTKVVDNTTGKEYNYSYTKKKVMEDSTAFMINDLLQTAYGGKGVSGTTIGGKTGTTNLDKDTKTRYNLPNGAVMDAWIVSYSPSYSIALWYGYDQIYKNAREEKLYLTSSTGGTGRRTMMNALATGIYPKNKTFKKPSSIVSVDVELETFPGQLCSSYTPSELCESAYYVAGTEPTDVSKRFSTLDAPTGGNYTFDGSKITITWNPIKSPNAIDLNYLRNHFDTYYEDYADKYYEQRIQYNNSYIGTLGYEISLVDSSGKETVLGYTNSTSFTYNTTVSSENYTFKVRSAYSIFKSNKSDPLIIKGQSSIDSNTENLIH